MASASSDGSVRSVERMPQPTGLRMAVATDCAAVVRFGAAMPAVASWQREGHGSHPPSVRVGRARRGRAWKESRRVTPVDPWRARERERARDADAGAVAAARAEVQAQVWLPGARPSGAAEAGGAVGQDAPEHAHSHQREDRAAGRVHRADGRRGRAADRVLGGGVPRILAGRAGRQRL